MSRAARAPAPVFGDRARAPAAVVLRARADADVAAAAGARPVTRAADLMRALSDTPSNTDSTVR
jgi:hypothetical protein